MFSYKKYSFALLIPISRKLIIVEELLLSSYLLITLMLCSQAGCCMKWQMLKTCMIGTVSILNNTQCLKECKRVSLPMTLALKWWGRRLMKHKKLLEIKELYGMQFIEGQISVKTIRLFSFIYEIIYNLNYVYLII